MLLEAALPLRRPRLSARHLFARSGHRVIFNCLFLYSMELLGSLSVNRPRVKVHLALLDYDVLVLHFLCFVVLASDWSASLSTHSKQLGSSRHRVMILLEAEVRALSFGG